MSKAYIYKFTCEQRLYVSDRDISIIIFFYVCFILTKAPHSVGIQKCVVLTIATYLFIFISISIIIIYTEFAALF